MTVKKLYLLFILLTAALYFVLFSNGMTTSTTSEIKVLKKAHSKDFKEAWIQVIDPNSTYSRVEIKIMVEEPMIWNLIEERTSYLTTYEKNEDNPWVLTFISKMGDEQSLR
ncbi:hypothetical protein [Peribacillus deserti]|uniref:Uncharacterized protein n=1 Tax=Peribacillus deserti TaxID=673318 RepID=A0A2N5M3C2_9BACI|nr:hypothetical protein [Peribacillus deserti]PLT28866.1 hypothetical protein CUU66_16085 [Peribacillus deserti]